MKTRGERNYINMPVFISRMYDNLTSVKGVNKTFKDIADFLDKKIKQGKLLDAGTGPGRLLYEINEKINGLELYGLDISASMLKIAKQNLQKIKTVNLQLGNIIKTEYKTDYFDCIVSTGSFYNWDNPVEGLNEIKRILKPGKTAYIIETTKDHDKTLLKKQLKINLKGYNIVRKILSKYFLKKQLKMTYTNKDFNEILKKTEFKNNFKIENIELGNLPIYVRLELTK